MKVVIHPDIIQTPHDTLAAIAQEVPVSDIPKKEIQELIKKMHHVLSQQDDGIGLAAPQINISKKIFVVSPRVFKNDPFAKLVYINPVITKVSKTKKWLEEGCLSVRFMYGKVHRHTHVTLEYYDEQGVKQTRGASGLLAHIFQHETDHLNGTLFIEKAKDVREYGNEKDEEQDIQDSPTT